MSADIRALEDQFNKAPNLDTCIPLCEAYLAASRFMEAMVVCKKGIKSAPSDPRGRVMLSRVYLEQGKLPKAQSELSAVAAEHPQNPGVLELQGRLAMAQGDNQTAAQFLMQALQLDPNLQDARTWLGQLGIQPPAPAQPAAVAAAAQPGMQQPGMQPPGMQPPGMQPPGMQQPGMQQPGMQQPGMQQPGMQPPGMQPPGMQPPGIQQPGIPGMHQPGIPQGQEVDMGAVADTFAGAGGGDANQFGSTPFDQPAPAAAPMEHVSDFFSTQALGFADDEGGPETAGPGRLTIIGFVPKSSGSIKTTILVALGVIAVAIGVLSYVWISSQNKREINDKFALLLEAMEQDKYVEYQKVLKLGQEILAIDDAQPLALSTLAYTHAILAHEHGEEDSLAKAKDYLRRATDASPEPNEWRVEAGALVAYHEGNIDAGLTVIKEVAEKSSRPGVWMEYFRLLRAKNPNDEETTKALRRTQAAVTGQARVLNFLGWHHFVEGRFNEADKNFASAIQNVKSHESALIGSAMADLERGVGLEQRQQEIEKNLKKVFALPAEELSQPVRALAYFARSQLRNWQGKGDEAKADYDKALKLDPKNALFPYRRGVAELTLGRPKEAVEYLKQAVKQDSKRVAYVIKLVEGQIKAGDLSGAEASLKKGLELDGNNWELLKAQGHMLIAKGQHSKAIEVFKKIDEKQGGTAIAQAQIGIGKAYREDRKALAAVKHLVGFMEKAPASAKNPPIQAHLWEALGLAYEAAGQKEKATTSFDAGIEVYRYYAPNAYHRCRMLKFKGAEARELCKTYLTLDPRGEYAAEVRRKTGLK